MGRGKYIMWHRAWKRMWDHWMKWMGNTVKIIVKWQFVYLFAYVCSAGNWTQDLMRARQAPYHWATSTAPSMFLKYNSVSAFTVISWVTIQFPLKVTFSSSWYLAVEAIMNSNLDTLLPAKNNPKCAKSRSQQSYGSHKVCLTPLAPGKMSQGNDWTTFWGEQVVPFVLNVISSPMCICWCQPENEILWKMKFESWGIFGYELTVFSFSFGSIATLPLKMYAF